MNAASESQWVGIGSADELGQVFMKYRGHLKNMVCARLDRRLQSRVDSSDIVQEIFIRANRSLATYLESPNVAPIVWLRQIGKHLVTETHRKHFRAKRSPNHENTFELENDDFLAQYLADSLQSIGSNVARAELYSNVQQLLLKLNPADREIIELRHLESATFQEASQILELPMETVKKRYYRALKKFQELAGPISDSNV